MGDQNTPKAALGGVSGLRKDRATVGLRRENRRATLGIEGDTDPIANVLRLHEACEFHQ